MFTMLIVFPKCLPACNCEPMHNDKSNLNDKLCFFNIASNQEHKIQRY